VDDGELDAGEEHAGVGFAVALGADLGDVFRVAGEGEAGESDGLLVEGGGDHGVGFAVEAHIGGGGDVGGRGCAVLGS
jgi:hypothetical protein